MSRSRIKTDGPIVTSDEATEFCVHHLRLAAMFFEASPDDGLTSILQELARVGEDRDKPGAMAFLKAIHKYYEGMKADD